MFPITRASWVTWESMWPESLAHSIPWTRTKPLYTYYCINIYIQIIRWWREFDSREKLLGFARDRIVECFYWSLGVFPEAKYSLSRISLAKQTCIITIIDDIYDSFGMLDELELFTEAFERSKIHWNNITNYVILWAFN